MLTDPHACDLCNGSGWVPVPGSLDAIPCSCQKETRRKQRVAAARVPKRYIHCTLQNFHDLGNIGLSRARKQIAEFVDCWPADDRGLLLMGGCGVGKTHLAVAAILEIVAQDKPGKLLFANFQDLVQEIQATFDANSPINKSEILSPLLDADLLVLDELGAQKPTQWVQDTLYYIINSRYNDVKATIFTTNYLDETARPGEEKLEERIGQRLASRLYTMTRFVTIAGAADYRRTVESRGV